MADGNEIKVGDAVFLEDMFSNLNDLSGIELAMGSLRGSGRLRVVAIDTISSAHYARLKSRNVFPDLREDERIYLVSDNSGEAYRCLRSELLTDDEARDRLTAATTAPLRPIGASGKQHNRRYDAS
ncbi:MAG TPA: hypothetical protein PLW86_13855 [Rhodocyclaceae bacterium]|nr:hypothetical protein [Rhodocyclaceae bacterium]